MLDIRPVVDDVPAAPVAALAPAKPDKAALDRRDLQRKCLRHWDTVFNMIVDLRGKSMLMQLGPNFRPNPDGHVRYGEPRLVSFSGPDHREETLGAWYNRGGDGASGSNLFELVMYLGQCDLKTATAFLKDLADRLVELPK